MGTLERRASQRLDHELEASFRQGSQVVPAQIDNVGRHGIFLRTERPSPVGQIVRTWISLPSQRGAPVTRIEVMALVARIVPIEEARILGNQPGMGMKFFMMASEDKARWDSFYAQLQRSQHTIFGSRRTIISPSGPVKFLVRPRDYGQLRRFQTHSLTKLAYFLRSPLLRRVDSRLQVLLIHPETKDEFPLNGKVVGVRAQGPLPIRGMKLQWLGVYSATLEEYQRFMWEGLHPIHECDLTLAD